MTFEQAILGLLAELGEYSTAEAWETCLACGCLCKPTEPCPGCEAARQTTRDLVNTT
jgi:hypothetical protein